jgi:molecular chaperone GrpE
VSSKKKKIKVNVANNDHMEENIEDTELAENISADDVELAEEAATEETEELEETEEIAEEDENPLVVQLEQAESRAADYLDSLQRERAAFQNYKKRVERERGEQVQAISANLLARLLPVIDDFHRAMDAVPENERNEWFEGVSLIQRKLDQILTNEGVSEIKALGKPFDPNYHEAIGVDTDTEAESGTVTQVLQRGYMLKDRVLRPAMVRVAE